MMEDIEGTDTEIERELSSVVIENGRVNCRWARRFLDPAGVEQVMWHREVFGDDNLPSDVAAWIAEGKAIVAVKRNDAAEFLSAAKLRKGVEEARSAKPEIGTSVRPVNEHRNV